MILLKHVHKKQILFRIYYSKKKKLFKISKFKKKSMRVWQSQLYVYRGLKKSYYFIMSLFNAS